MKQGLGSRSGAPIEQVIGISPDSRKYNIVTVPNMAQLGASPSNTMMTCLRV